MALILRRKLTYDPPHRGGDFAKLLPYYQHAHYYHRMMETMVYLPQGGTDFMDAGYCLDRPDEPPLPEDGSILAEIHEWGWTNFLAGIERRTREAQHTTPMQTANRWLTRSGRWSDRRSAAHSAQGPRASYLLNSGRLLRNRILVMHVSMFDVVEADRVDARDMDGNVHRVVTGRRRFYADGVELADDAWTHLLYIGNDGREHVITNPYNRSQRR